MARYIGPKCKLSRRGTDLFLKSARRSLDSSASWIPSLANTAALRAPALPTTACSCAKQKLKRMYGVLEKQFRKYFAEAERRRGNTGETLIQLLESRLDNVVYRMGFGSTRAEARQLVSHRAVELNGHTADIASMLVKAGDVITIRERPSKAVSRNRSTWPPASASPVGGSRRRQDDRHVQVGPDRADVARDINESMVVELYSR